MTAPTDPTPPPADKTFTQADVDRITAQTRDQAQRQGKQAQLDAIKEMFGCTPDEAKALLEKAREQENAALSEADRKLKEAADKETAATAKEQAAEAKVLAADVRAELVLQGAGAGETDAAKKAAILADAAKLVDVAAGADEAAIRAAVEAVKTRHPGMFTATAPQGTPHTPPGSGPPSNGNGPKSLADIAKEKFPEFAAAS